MTSRDTCHAPGSPPARATAALAACAVAIAACSGSGGKGGGGGAGGATETVRIAIPLGEAFTGVQVSANVPSLTPFTAVLPDDGMQAATVDLGASLAFVDVVPASTVTVATVLRLAAALATGDASFGISTTLPPGTVCDASIPMNRYTIGLSALFQPLSATPSAYEATASGIEKIRTGPFVRCVELLLPIDATVSLHGVVADVTRTACDEAPADLSGAWTGTYSCTYSCGQGFGGDIDLTVTQSGDQASYVDDGGARFVGRVCGKGFRFARNAVGETERGVMTLQPNGTAIKTSAYRGTLDGCSGECTDHLHRP